MQSLLDYHNINKKASEVDFVVPFLDGDRPYFIDPSLVRFTDDPRFTEWTRTIDLYTELINEYIKTSDHDGLRKILDTGEAKVIGLGYAKSSVDGSGVGKEIAESVIKVLLTNPDFKKSGIGRLEQLQFFDKGIASDRISDLSAHVLKEHLVEYTREQCKLLGIPMEQVRVGKIFDYANHEWREKKYYLPVNPEKINRQDAVNPHPAILFVPREIVRPLPIYLNYDSFTGFLRREKIIGENKVSKDLIASKARADLTIVDRYTRERESLHEDKLTRRDFSSDAIDLADRLEVMPIGQEHRDKFRDLVGEVIQELFPGELNLYKTESSTAIGSNRRDLIFQNFAVGNILEDLKREHKAQHIIVDSKNVKKLDADDIKQVAGYLNDRTGMTGVIVIPGMPSKANLNAVKDLYLHEKKVLLLVSKSQLINSLRGQSRVLLKGNKPKPIFDPHILIANLVSDIILS